MGATNSNRFQVRALELQLCKCLSFICSHKEASACECLQVDDALKKRTCGLCGLYDGTPDNDFYLQDGSVVTSESTFASDYKQIDLTGGSIIIPFLYNTLEE